MSVPIAAASTAPAAPGPVLRDIHLPPDPPWWPPAPGWWALAGLLLIAAMLAGWAWRRQVRQVQRRARAFAELDRLMDLHAGNRDPSELASGMHQLLRRVARRHDALAGRQRGNAWRQTLARVPVDAATLDRLMALEQAIYCAPPAFDQTEAAAAVRQWLRLALKPSTWKRAGSATSQDGMQP